MLSYEGISSFYPCESETSLSRNIPNVGFHVRAKFIPTYKFESATMVTPIQHYH